MTMATELQITLQFDDATTRTYAIPVADNIDTSTVTSRINAANQAFGTENPTTAAEHAADGIRNTFVSNDYDPDNPIRAQKINKAVVVTSSTVAIYHYGTNLS